MLALYYVLHFFHAIVTLSYHGSGVVPLNDASVEYPADMERQGKEGKVILACDIEITGKTSNCHVTQSSGEKSFDDEALRYVKSAIYKPASINGVFVKEHAHRYTVNFRL